MTFDHPLHILGACVAALIAAGVVAWLVARSIEHDARTAHMDGQ